MTDRPGEARDTPDLAGLLSTARALATDRACAEVVAALSRRGIGSILLKGPTIAEWLYPEDVRGYVDADLLVDPRQVLAAADVLRELGFLAFEHHVSLHAHPWSRAADGAAIDLHVTLWGPHRSAQSLWLELQRWVEVRRLGSTPVQVLTEPARALHVVLHALQHRDQTKPREDLRRAIQCLPLEVWLEAERVGDRLWALEAMAGGLSLEPAGAALLQALPLTRAALAAQAGGAPLAVGVARLAQARGMRAKLSVLAQALSAASEPPGPDLVRPGLLRTSSQLVRRAARLALGAPRTLLALRRLRTRRGL